MNSRIDHFVIGAPSLAQGVAYVERTLGVQIPPGGAHTRMGTHNHLMKLGDQVFLEVIASDPQLSEPDGPRWYGLDDPFVRTRIAAEPCLLTWVVNCDDIHSLLAGQSFDYGRIERCRGIS